jgi:hypothetical protein
MANDALALTGEREVTLTFVMSAAERDAWETFADEHGLSVADVFHLAALGGLKYQAKAGGDDIKALVAERCERWLSRTLRAGQGAGERTALSDEGGPVGETPGGVYISNSAL